MNDSVTPDDPSHDSVESAPEAVERSNGSKPGRRWLLVAAVLIVVGTGVGWEPVSQFLNDRKIEQLRQGTKADQALEDWDQLERAATEWLKLDPGSVDATLKLALAQEKNGDIDAAAATLATVPDDDDRVLDALAIRIDMLLSQLNRPSEAEAACRRLIRINSLAGRGYQRLIYYYAMTLQRARLSELIYAAIDAGCEPPEAYTYQLLLTSLSFTDGEETCSRWLQGEPDNEAVRVAHAWHKGRVSSSAAISEASGIDSSLDKSREMTEMLTAFPANLEVLAFHLERALDDGNWAAAVKLLGKAPSEAEADSRFWRYKAVILASKGSNVAAVEAAREGLLLNTIDWRGHHQLASLLRLTAKPEEASRESAIALAGKRLERELLELPSARAWGPGVPGRAMEYLRQCGDDRLLRAIAARLNGD